MNLTASTTVKIKINADTKTVFAQTVPIDLSIIFKRYGPIPAVVKTVPAAGAAWDKSGLVRQVFLADGNTARETLTKVDAPLFFSYKVFDFTNFINIFAEYAAGEWHFQTNDSATSVRWTYTFTARNALARLPLLFIIKTFFRGYMKQAMKLLKEHIEKDILQKRK